MKKFTKVVAAQRIRVGRCHGGRYFKRPAVPSWYLWLACGHHATRRAGKVPRKVKCNRCVWDKEHGYRKARDWFKNDLPEGLGVIRF
jgi:hypothetical protein